METSKVLTTRRTIRKFTQEKIPKNILEKLIEYACLSAYPANINPLKFSIIDDEKILNNIFPYTKWAGYIPDGAPKENERPTAYIAIFGDKEIKDNFLVESGAAITSMMLGAWDLGIGSCWIGALDRSPLLKILGESDEKYELVYLLALGYPAQMSKAIKMTDSVKYFEDENHIINVPKKSIEDVLI